MSRTTHPSFALVTLLALSAAAPVATSVAAQAPSAHPQAAGGRADRSPWGPRDEIGTLNMMTAP